MNSHLGSIFDFISDDDSESEDAGNDVVSVVSEQTPMADETHRRGSVARWSGAANTVARPAAGAL